MTASTFSRLVYRSILHLHPRAFRDRFSTEMLWIFDEECHQRGAFRMVRDGAISLVRQYTKNYDDSCRTQITGIGCQVVAPRISPTRVVQAGLAASILLLAFVFALGRPPKPLTFVRPSKEVQSLPQRLHAPVRIEHLTK